MKTNEENKYYWDIKNPVGYNNRMGIYKTKKELSFIKSHINFRTAKILDIGGGGGRFAIPLKDEGFDITVIDIAEEAINLAKQRGLDKSYCIDIKNFKEGGFDIALGIELFLVTKPDILISESKRILKDNGLLIFVGANRNSWKFRLKKLIKKESSFYDLSSQEYLQLLSENGFELIEILGFNWMPFIANSNNILIPVFSIIENISGLGRWIAQSPWLMVACRSKNKK